MLDWQNKLMLEELQLSTPGLMARSQQLLFGSGFQLPETIAEAQTSFVKDNAINIKRTMMWPTMNKERQTNLALSRQTLVESVKRSREEQA